MKTQKPKLTVTWKEYEPIYKRSLEIEERENEIHKVKEWYKDESLEEEYYELVKEESDLCDKERKLRPFLIPEVGMPCTVHYYSDRSSGYVIEVPTPNTIVVQQDGIYHGQKIYTFRSNGHWVEKGSTSADWSTICSLGYRDNYYDRSF